MNKKIFCALIIIVSLTLTLPCFAQVMVNKSKIKLKAQPGESITGSVKVHNTSERSVEIKVYMQDFDYVEPFEGQKKFLPAGSQDNSCANWVSFSPRQFQLPAFAEKEVNYSIRVPQDASGGYHSILFLEQPAKSVSGKVGLRVIARIGCLFFVEIGDEPRQASVQGFTVDDNHIKAVFANKDNLVLIPEGTFYILDQEGMAVQRGELTTYYIPPDKSREFQIPVKDKIPAGSYSLILTFNLGDEALVKEVDFKKTDIGLEVLRVRD
jgi:hypothetical protein